MVVTGKMSWHTNEGRAEGMVGTEEGFCTSLVGNICSAPILRTLIHIFACGDTCQQWRLWRGTFCARPSCLFADLAD